MCLFTMLSSDIEYIPQHIQIARVIITNTVLTYLSNKACQLSKQKHSFASL